MIDNLCDRSNRQLWSQLCRTNADWSRTIYMTTKARDAPVKCRMVPVRLLDATKCRNLDTPATAVTGTLHSKFAWLWVLNRRSRDHLYLRQETSSSSAGIQVWDVWSYNSTREKVPWVMKSFLGQVDPKVTETVPSFECRGLWHVDGDIAQLNTPWSIICNNASE